MFGLFKKKKYREEVLPKVHGEAHGIKVTLKNYPIRVEESNQGGRFEYYPDFNSRLIYAIWGEIKDYDDFAKQANTGIVSLNVRVEDAPVFILDIQVSCHKSQREFTEEMPDAIINAFKSENIGR